ncbi:MAG: hypothetical protein O3A63_14770 [Proteobacteria bacterium]|nr:hypothetical protein [Pseudomonadota bacterium]
MPIASAADELLTRLTSVFGDRLPPRPQFDDAIQRFMASIDLVPRHEMERHLAALEALRQQVQILEQRISVLETGNP